MYSVHTQLVTQSFPSSMLWLFTLSYNLNLDGIQGPFPKVFPYYSALTNLIVFTFLFSCQNLVEDPFSQGLILGQECTSLLELPIMGAPWFRLILEKFFVWVSSPTIWGMTRVEYITKTGPRLSGEATPMAILDTDGVGKGDLGMVTTFCSHNQFKMEVS